MVSGWLNGGCESIDYGSLCASLRCQLKLMSQLMTNLTSRTTKKGKKKQKRIGSDRTSFASFPFNLKSHFIIIHSNNQSKNNYY